MTKPVDNKKIHAINQSDVLDERIQYVRIDGCDDELSLVDLINVFIKQKVIFLSVVLLVFFLGVLYVFNKPSIYSYSVLVEIGREASKGRLLENVDKLLNKINEKYIPVISKKILQKHSGQQDIPLIRASKKKSGDLVSLESEGIIESQSINLEFISALVGAIVLDHERIETVYRKEQERVRAKINNSINRLKIKERQLASKKNRLKDKEAFLKKRLGLIGKSLVDFKEARQNTAKKGNAEDNMWALFVVDNALRTAEDQLFSFEEQLNFELVEESEILEIEIFNNVNEQSILIDKLDVIKLKMDNASETRALSEPVKSINPVGKSKVFILLIFAVAGVFASFFAVFIAELISKTREQS